LAALKYKLKILDSEQGMDVPIFPSILPPSRQKQTPREEK